MSNKSRHGSASPKLRKVPKRTRGYRRQRQDDQERRRLRDVLGAQGRAELEARMSRPSWFRRFWRRLAGLERE